MNTYSSGNLSSPFDIPREHLINLLKSDRISDSLLNWASLQLDREITLGTLENVLRELVNKNDYSINSSLRRNPDLPKNIKNAAVCRFKRDSSSSEQTNCVDVEDSLSSSLF